MFDLPFVTKIYLFSGSPAVKISLYFRLIVVTDSLKQLFSTNYSNFPSIWTYVLSFSVR